MRYGRIVWCITAALLVALVLNLRPSQLPPSDGVATGAGGEHQAATWHQLGAALGWSMISGLATGVGGAVVFFLEDDAGVSSWLNAFLLGLAVGVMMLLSIADMIVPNVLKYGLLTGAPPIGAGVLLIYLLDCLIDRFGLGGGTGGFPVGASPGLPAPAASPGRSKKTASGSSNSDGAGRLRSAMLTTLALAAHNAPEGLAVGMASLSAENDGTGGQPTSQAVHHTAFVVFAIALHNIPEGISVAVAIYNAPRKPGRSVFQHKLRAALISTASAIFCCKKKEQTRNPAGRANTPQCAAAANRAFLRSGALCCATLPFCYGGAKL